MLSVKWISALRILGLAIKLKLRLKISEPTLIIKGVTATVTKSRIPSAYGIYRTFQKHVGNHASGR